MSEIKHIFAAIVDSEDMFFIGRLSKTDKKVLESIQWKQLKLAKKYENGECNKKIMYDI